LISENQPEWGIVYLGASQLGVVLVPLDAQTWPKEVWAVAGFTEAKAIIASERCLKKLGATEQLLENEKSEHPILLLRLESFCEPWNQPELPRSTAPPSEQPKTLQLPELTGQDEASIIFTTGTSADPRGAVHTHASFLANLRGVNHHLSVSQGDQLLSVLPLYHALEFTCGFLMPIYGGSTVTYVHSLKPKVILEVMRETGTTCMLGVPTLYSLIRDDVERRILKTTKSSLKANLMETSKQLSHSIEDRLGHNVGRHFFSRVHSEFGGKIRVFVSGGSALGERLYQDFKALGMPIYEGYGLTETAPVLTVNPLHRSRVGSAGKPLPGVELRLYHPDRDGVGEVIVRTPSLMKEYFRNPEATAACLRDGWFHTGDLGWVDADGYLYITGRVKDVIVTGAGKNVYPTDLEAIYRTLDIVEDVCVFGVKSGLTEEVNALVYANRELLAGQVPEEAKKTVQKAIQGLARELPSYHRLQAIHMAEEPLPRDQQGKLDRAAVRQTVLGRKLSARAPAEVIPAAGKTDIIFSELTRISGLEREEIDETSHLYTDLGLDSLMAIELLLALERRFGVSIPDDRAVSLQTVGDLLDEARKVGLDQEPAAAGIALELRSALPFPERPPMDRAIMGASFTALRTLFTKYFDLTIENEAVLPRTGSYVIAANHSSHLDTAAIIAAVTLALGVKEARRLHVIGAKDYFFSSQFKSWLFSTCLNVVPIERGEISLLGLRQVSRILAQGEPVLIFPEGTRSRTGELQEFKPGVGLVAWEQKTPIVPAFISGTYEALRPGKVMPTRQKICVAFSRPIHMRTYEGLGEELSLDEIYRRITTDLQALIVDLSEKQTASA
jgi:long-chain acyl-CoA synthetase